MKKKVLNLYAGLGGNRKLWEGVEVTAIEKDPKIASVYKSLYRDDEVIVTDAHQYLKYHYEEFDIVWGSPPCQKHSRMMKATRHKVADYPDMKLYEEIIFLDNFFKGNWVIENVVPYYGPLIPPTARIGRHLFWSNMQLEGIEDVKRPKGFINKSNLKGKQEMMDWLGIHYKENIYYGNNHCPVQILRNCVHPKLGLQIFDKLSTNIKAVANI